MAKHMTRELMGGHSCCRSASGNDHVQGCSPSVGQTRWPVAVGQQAGPNLTWVTADESLTAIWVCPMRCLDDQLLACSPISVIMTWCVGSAVSGPLLEHSHTRSSSGAPNGHPHASSRAWKHYSCFVGEGTLAVGSSGCYLMCCAKS